MKFSQYLISGGAQDSSYHSLSNHADVLLVSIFQRIQKDPDLKHVGMTFSDGFDSDHDSRHGEAEFISRLNNSLDNAMKDL